MPALPSVNAAYFAAQAHPKRGAFEACFAKDAVVRDEGEDHRGLEAIIAWRAKTMAKTPFVARPIAVTGDGNHAVVAVEISGAFPGSPVTLDHDFELRDGAIAALRIG